MINTKSKTMHPQQGSSTEEQRDFDFIVCGAGSSGSVVAARLAKDESVKVLLIEAGGGDHDEKVSNPAMWPLNLGTERDWGFLSAPTPELAGRRLQLNMGKGLGGGSSINVMVWARGHKADWDYFAHVSGDPAWGYDSILGYYRRIENWQGSPDQKRRGTDGPVYVAPPKSPHSAALALTKSAQSLGIPVFDSPNGEMMEGSGGAAIADLRIRDGKRETVFDSYIGLAPLRPNLTIVTHAMVTRVLFEGKKAIGVEISKDGELQQYRARCETILSMGAINTPKVLMQSGVGDQEELSKHGIAVVQHLPGVGRNHQDHIAFGCTWAYKKAQEPQAGGCEATLYWKSQSHLTQPDILQCQLEFPVPSPEETQLETPEHGWTMFAGLAQPKSRGRIRLSGPGVNDPMIIEPNTLSDPEDMAAALAAVNLCREVGNDAAFRSLVQNETAPGARDEAGMIDFIRKSGVTYWHQSCTAKMGQDSDSVVDGQLRVYGIENLRVADSSIMPRITSGNTMAPCVVIGERAADMILAQHSTHQVLADQAV
ncbi:GMC family oxidoreductase [Sulfitobacter sp. 20_GPM-1509m]|uniref:GMC family oxidoreductase n=1 Tax=Sulfitobacter sp. 20_GPM-1509m TaxID=1380367 RepID=UPI0009DFC988|nr:GMC family oxidoreductase N-terminal domain-containing protein [Sulfitobacter sp. 20_GPM-1509m]